MSANDSQDMNILNFKDLRRHYNRDYFANETEDERIGRRRDAAFAYQGYLDEEINNFYKDLQRSWFGLGPRDCKAALKDLGRLSHSWQDFYGHGIYPWGWESPGIILDSPSLIGDLWPSSYGSVWAEHPLIGEPPFSAEETALRTGEAYYYVTLQFKLYLSEWNNVCDCDCGKL